MTTFTDDNNNTFELAEETTRVSVDLTQKGDMLTIVQHQDLYVVTDDLQNHTHVTEDIEQTIESYIEKEQNETIKHQLIEMLQSFKTVKK